MSLMPILPTSRATKYRLDLASDDGVSLSMVSGTTIGLADNFAWKPDGTRLFAADNTGTGTLDVAYWDLSTPWDISTASYVSALRLRLSAKYAQVMFNANGSTMFVTYTGSIETYTLSANYGGTPTFQRNDTLKTPGSVDAAFFNSDGTEIFYSSSGTLYKRPLSGAYDMSTLGAESTEAALSGTLTVGRNGTRLISNPSSGGNLTEYKTNSAYDFSSTTQINTFATGATRRAAWYSGNGAKLHVLSSNGQTMTQYSTVG